MLGQNRADYFGIVDVHLAAVGLDVEGELFSVEGVGGGCRSGVGLVDEGAEGGDLLYFLGVGGEKSDVFQYF